MTVSLKQQEEVHIVTAKNSRNDGSKVVRVLETNLDREEKTGLKLQVQVYIEELFKELKNGMSLGKQ